MRTSTITALAVRVFIALLTRTFFQPDEYFQSLEVAHHAVYGYGHLTWEWLATKPFRSILYPAINIPVYWLLQLSGLDGTKLLVSVGPPLVRLQCSLITCRRYGAPRFYMALSRPERIYGCLT